MFVFRQSAQSTYLYKYVLLYYNVRRTSEKDKSTQLHQTDCQRWQPLTTIIRRVERVKRNLPYLEYFLYTGRVTETTE